MENQRNQKGTKTESKLQTSYLIKTQFNPNYITALGEVNNEPSLTTPDMALTCRELLLNHSRGIGSNVHTYDENAYFNTEIPVFDDINDVREYRENLQQQIKETENAINKYNKEKEKAASDLLNKLSTTTPNTNEV